jgi:hypothetical protein
MSKRSARLLTDVGPGSRKLCLAWRSDLLALRILLMHGRVSTCKVCRLTPLMLVTTHSGKAWRPSCPSGSSLPYAVPGTSWGNPRGGEGIRNVMRWVADVGGCRRMSRLRTTSADIRGICPLMSRRVGMVKLRIPPPNWPPPHTPKISPYIRPRGGLAQIFPGGEALPSLSRVPTSRRNIRKICGNVVDMSQDFRRMSRTETV